MQVILETNGRKVAFEANAATPFLYKQNTGNDFFKDLFKMAKQLQKMERLDELTDEELENVNMDTIYHIAWTFAKCADKSTPSLIEWLTELGDCTLEELVKTINPLIMGLMQKKKKPPKKKPKQRRTTLLR